MATFVLTDVAHDLWVESFAIDNETLGLPADGRWSVSKRRLRGGRRDGVDLIQVKNGPLEFSIVPTRGMNLWKGSHLGLRLGWDSPVADGPVNPAFVNLSGLGGLGWLDGFDELLARCGLAWSGAPFEVKALKADGSESHTTFGLHGKIANIPASYVAVHVGDSPPHEIVVEGHVDESHLFGPHVRMITRISTTPGANHLVVRDEFVNLGDQPMDMQVLYHWNFGPPFLEEGSRFAAPFRAITPRDPRAVEGLSHHDVYGPPEPGSTEQVYFYELHARVGPGQRDAGHAPEPGGRQGRRAPVPQGPAPLLHPLEEHGRPPRRLRHRPGARHQLPQPSPVREGPQPRRDAARRWPLHRRDHPRGPGQPPRPSPPPSPRSTSSRPRALPPSTPVPASPSPPRGEEEWLRNWLPSSYR